jgi:redox-sensing transcriptional repressor
MRYHRFLAEVRGRLPPETVTSGQISEGLDVDPTQVRKDLGSVRLRGRGRVGYDVDEVIGAIRKALGFDRTHPGIVIGAGHLGSALAAYRGFERYGIRIVAAFDRDPARIGQEVAGRAVLDIRTLRAYVTAERIRLAVLATPPEVSQEVADDLVAAGIRAIWNFAPVRLTVPEGVCVRDEHISVGAAHLTHHLTRLADPDVGGSPTANEITFTAPSPPLHLPPPMLHDGERTGQPGPGRRR